MFCDTYNTSSQNYPRLNWLKEWLMLSISFILPTPTSAIQLKYQIFHFSKKLFSNQLNWKVNTVIFDMCCCHANNRDHFEGPKLKNIYLRQLGRQFNVTSITSIKHTMLQNVFIYSESSPHFGLTMWQHENSLHKWPQFLVVFAL